jgi:IS605 OrfB family transposase
MKLTVCVKLLPTPEQARALRETLVRANAACNLISQIAWDNRVFGQFKIHRLAYHRVRQETGLTAQVVVRAIAKVADAYKLDRKRQRRFKELGAFPFDDRLLRWKQDAVSIWTVAGRQTIPFVCDERTRALLTQRQGETDLVFRDGMWFLYPTVNVEEPPPGDPTDFIGVDLGIVNLAVTSDDEIVSGAHVNGLRIRHERLRRRLQAKGTKSAKRLLRKRRRKQSRFQKDVNHRIAKQIVAVAKGTGRGIALEDLKGIRDRTTVRKRQRSRHGNWAFHQLRSFITYKAALAGVPVVLVNPRNTSRTCPTCGYIDKNNRVSQSCFSCQSCGFSAAADLVAAENIRRAAVNQPYAALATE